MSPVKAFFAAIPDTRLRVLADEALAWRSKGVLLGEELRTLSKEAETACSFPADDSLGLVDRLLVEEAARRFAAAAAEAHLWGIRTKGKNFPIVDDPERPLSLWRDVVVSQVREGEELVEVVIRPAS